MVHRWATKCTYSEAFEDISRINKTSPNAKVQGLLRGVPSNMKQATTCSYWDGELLDSDGALMDMIIKQDAGCSISSKIRKQ